MPNMIYAQNRDNFLFVFRFSFHAEGPQENLRITLPEEGLAPHGCDLPPN
jgi:hypothetical protein